MQNRALSPYLAVIESAWCGCQVVQAFYAQFTGQPIERVEEETDRDNFMSPQQAIDFGLIDAII
jgi:ATP-dependent protease ClpP protease subunit